MSYYPEAPLILHGAVVASFSDDEFFDFCQANPDLRMERTAQGEIIIMTPAGFVSSAQSLEVARQLGNWNKKTKLGRVADSSAGYVLPDGATLSPDASWVSLTKLEDVSLTSRRKFLHLCPEFVVEVISPTDRLADAQAKMAQWLANGAQLGLLLTDSPETAYIYRPGQPVEEMQGFDNELSGEPVLPGFTLDLRELREAAA
ncbi:Uma2 family endonuclease [Hymenobacter sp. RP-2-7]|uniref:Uma2 family endonuclease n=1 Tax=Hymenobacter polaris TaxID=2682546 RepID=A0A7Y0AIR5_9BACT|nr:Uma2 family endonuclease [Hymenobacter polaris]NML68034.1 Uma2 family endonuclease [Hymenobacter polaris]